MITIPLDDLVKAMKAGGMLVTYGLSDVISHKHQATKEEKESKSKPMEVKGVSLHSLISTGGRVVIVGGMKKSWEQFRNDPRLVFWTGDRSEIERRFKSSGDSMPSNAHGVIISKFLGHSQLRKVLEEARRRRMVIMGPKSDGEVARLIQEILTPDAPPVADYQGWKRGQESKQRSFAKEQEVDEQVVAEAEVSEAWEEPEQVEPEHEPEPEPELDTEPEPPPKRELPPVPSQRRSPRLGELKEYVQRYDNMDLSVKESAESILKELEAAGIFSTYSSVAQAIYVNRRGGRVETRKKVEPVEQAKPEPPKPEPAKPVELPVPPKAEPVIQRVSPEDGTELLLKMIDDLMAGMTLLKEEVKRMHREAADYRELEAMLDKLGFRRK